MINRIIINSILTFFALFPGVNTFGDAANNTLTQFLREVLFAVKGKKYWAAAGGAAAGILNGMLGAGGGMVVVPLFSALGVRGKKSHATALMVIVPLSLVSAVLYLIDGRFTLGDALPYLPGCLLGALLGSWLLPRVATGWIKLVFGGLLLWGGIRLL